MIGPSSYSKPNILLFLADQHRGDWTPLSSSLPIYMPNLTDLMARGMCFSRAFTPSPLCAPARACLASGKRYEECGVPSNETDYPIEQPTYYQVLRDAGYNVAGVGKFDLHKATHDWGLDGSRLLREWGFTAGIDNEGKIDAVTSGADEPMGPYMAYLHQQGLAKVHVDDFRQRSGGRRGYTATHATPLPPEAYCDNWIADNGLSILQRLPADRPWHLVVNFAGPHSPMDVTPSMQAEWDHITFPAPVENDQLGIETHQRIRRNYAAMLKNIDQHIGRYLALLETRGELEQTLVLYSSDHGEMLGDHNRWGKCSYYQPSVSVPLVIAGPTVRRATVSDALVVLQDLTATFLDVANTGPLPEMEGHSLMPVLRGESGSHRAHVYSALGEWCLVDDGRFKLVRGALGGNRDLLFDRLSDPSERMDVAEQLPDEVQRLAHLIDDSPGVG